jgi:GMC oxidoreductase
LSGIGPQEELESFNIPVIVENDQVGANLNDHSTADIFIYIFIIIFYYLYKIYMPSFNRAIY